MDNKKLQGLIKEAFHALPDEQKAKAVSCGSADELIALLSKAGAPLPDDLLDTVAGGADPNNPEDMCRFYDEWCRRLQERKVDQYDFIKINQIWDEVWNEIF